MHFLRARGLSLAVVVLVMCLVAVLQAGVSYSVERGPLQTVGSTAFRVLVAGLYAGRIGFLLMLALLWVLNRKRALFRVIIAANTYFTLGLILDVISLIQVLGGSRAAAGSLLLDAALMSVSNMLVFSIW